MKRSAAVLLSALAALAAATEVQAQYKITESDGRVTYTDRLISSPTARIQPMRNVGGAAPNASLLPYALRLIAERFPVTFYSTANCSVCDSGRSLLRQRGVPYVERSVTTEADLDALKRIESIGELPLLRIGSQQLRGFSDDDWRSYLDAAGYPQQSQLPAGYAGWDAAPLAPRAAAAPANAARQPAVAAEPGAAALPPSLESAPNGIRF